MKKQNTFLNVLKWTGVALVLGTVVTLCQDPKTNETKVLTEAPKIESQQKYGPPAPTVEKTPKVEVYQEPVETKLSWEDWIESKNTLCLNDPDISFELCDAIFPTLKSVNKETRASIADTVDSLGYEEAVAYLVLMAIGDPSLITEDELDLHIFTAELLVSAILEYESL
jgi:hypothetical protein